MDKLLTALDGDFQNMYAKVGRPPIPPESLLRALMVQVLYSVRSERMLMDQLEYNFLFRWFVGMGMDDEVWDANTFRKNRDRLLGQEISGRFFEEVLAQAKAADLLSAEHFTVGGTFIETWASQKSFRPKDESDDDPKGGSGRNAKRIFHGEKRNNQTHESTTNSDARLMRKGGEGAKLVHHGHVLAENRNRLVVAAEVTVKTGTCEIEAAQRLIQNRGRYAAGNRVGG